MLLPALYLRQTIPTAAIEESEAARSREDPDIYAQCLDDAYKAVATAIHAAEIPDVHGHEAVLSLCSDLHVSIEPCSFE